MKIEVETWRGVKTLTLPLVNNGYAGIVDAEGKQIMEVDACYGIANWLIDPYEIINKLYEQKD